MTNVMKTAAYIVLVLGIIGSIILGVISKSFWVFLLYALVSFMSCLTWFVMVEISEKIDYLSEQLSRTERNIKASTAEQSGGSASDSGSGLSSLAYSSGNVKTVNGHWVCPKCKKSNSSSQRVCKDCGYNR